MPEQELVNKLDGRKSGVLLHLTSLPGTKNQGTLGDHAFRFVDFLSASGFKLWQILPLVPTHSDCSPYNGLSTFAGNPELLDFSEIESKGWLTDRAKSYQDRTDIDLWQEIYQQFIRSGESDEQCIFEKFILKELYWLKDYALYLVIKSRFRGKEWSAWPGPYRDREGETIYQVSQESEDEIRSVYFQQFLFFSQWRALKAYANKKNISIIGDLPIFLAHDSADCWSNRDLYKLDDEGNPLYVAGVPPDYFSATGQRWGNPCYDWSVHQKTNYRWWQQRVIHHLKLFDLTRIDHFRGFAACWEIPAEEEVATNGCWQPGPGEELFESVAAESELGSESLAIIAEDLGVITEDVEKLRDTLGFPGMKILQFAFDSDSSNPYLPHNHINNCVVYTGTHDNNTILGWYDELDDKLQDRVSEYYCHPQQKFPWPLINGALASVANLAIIPMQDLLELDASRRMNTPGTVGGNWGFRFQWDEVPSALNKKLHKLNIQYGRC